MTAKNHAGTHQHWQRHHFMQNEKGKDGQTYTKRTGICFETQFFPNSINVKSFTPCVIKAGETFESETMYKFIF